PIVSSTGGASKKFHRGFGWLALSSKRPAARTHRSDCFGPVVDPTAAQRTAGNVSSISRNPSNRQTTRVDHVASDQRPRLICRFRRSLFRKRSRSCHPRRGPRRARVLFGRLSVFRCRSTFARSERAKGTGEHGSVALVREARLVAEHPT